MQNELVTKYPKANLRVYAVWFNMYPGDARSKWPPDLLTDPRVIQRWDEPKAVGLWYAPYTASIRQELASGSSWSNGPILWDAYLLYGTDARWFDAPTSGLIQWGRTIVSGRDTLKEDFAKLFAT
ncbi:MAG TPA: hypothetical protein VGL62_09755, partial [Vicinamibacterales bacterium]